MLNALEAQTLPRERWEVVVCYDDAGTDLTELVATHPLAQAGVLRAVHDPRRSVGAKRNVAVKLAHGPVLVFTDDDCRPPPDWLARVADAVGHHPGAVIQGPIAGDPDEWAMRRGPYPMTQAFSEVPRAWAECCNIVYPREAVLAVGGFAEHMDGGEDTDLNLRVQAAGFPYVGDESMLTYHAIIDASVAQWIQASRRWANLPELLRRHPQLRRELLLGVFWKREHLWLLLGLVGLRGASRHPWRALAVLPWAVGRGAHGENLRGHVRDLTELPGWALVDLAELLALARGSLRHRTIVL